METPSETEIRSRIARRGKIPFAEFVELALYHPRGGYYSTGKARQEADYFTSPAAHPVFGALIAVQMHRIWELLSRPERFFAVELGAGTGRLARDVVEHARSAYPDFGRALRYLAIDLGPAVAPSPGVQPILADGVPLRGMVGCFLSNELLDALPFHRFQIVGGRVMETYVAVEDGRLASVLDEPSSAAVEDLVLKLGPLPDGFQGEVRPLIGPWMHSVAVALEKAFVITIDYGDESSGLYSTSRERGTTHAYSRHMQAEGPYTRIGRQDITAHVDFTQVSDSGASAGLTRLGLTSQAEFLRAMGIELFLDDLRQKRLNQRERDANRAAMLELLKPEGLGGFKVLVQERSTGVKELSMLAPEQPSLGVNGTPLLGAEHISLLEGRYPHLAMDFEELWPGREPTRYPGDTG